MMLDYDSIEKRMAQKELKIEKLKLKQSNPEDIDKLRSSIEQVSLILIKRTRKN